jgi:hypothetical protein
VLLVAVVVVAAAVGLLLLSRPAPDAATRGIAADHKEQPENPDDMEIQQIKAEIDRWNGTACTP